MSCKLQTENISNILCNYLCALYNQSFLCRFHQFSVQSKCVPLLQWSQSTQSTFLPFLPFLGGSSFPKAPQWLVLPFFFGTVFLAMVDCLFHSLITTTSSSFWHTLNFTTSSISSNSLNWLANVSFVWNTDEWFHQTRTYFFLFFIKTMLANWKKHFYIAFRGFRSIINIFNETVAIKIGGCI